jgi:hypothetical protein
MKKLCTNELIYITEGQLLSIKKTKMYHSTNLWKKTLYYWTNLLLNANYWKIVLLIIIVYMLANKHHRKKTLKMKKNREGQKESRGREGAILVSQCFSGSYKVVLVYYWTTKEHNTLLLKTNGHIGFWILSDALAIDYMNHKPIDPRDVIPAL